MPHATKCLTPVKGRRLRVTRLDSCGRPVYGEDSQAVSKGFINVSFTANTTESDEINLTNASGEVCVFEASVQTLTGYTLEIQFCGVDPDLLSIVTGQPVVLGADGETVIGFDIDTSVEVTAVNYAFELWMGAPTGNACVPGSTGKFGYLLLPFLSGGILGDFTVENAAVTFTVTGSATKDGNAWGVGPYSDIMLGNQTPTPLPGPMSTPVSATTALRLIETDLMPPEPVCGARPLMDPALPALTAVEATGTGLEADFTVTPVATGPVFYDFGDGTWDYVAAPGAASHTYAAAGTYTVQATQNGVWVQTVVTVPFP
jgi:hypothetical protein